MANLFTQLQQQASAALKAVEDLGKNVEAARTALSTTELENLRDQYRNIRAKTVSIGDELDAALGEAEKKG